VARGGRCRDLSEGRVPTTRPVTRRAWTANALDNAGAGNGSTACVARLRIARHPQDPLAIGFGIKACQHGYGVAFATAQQRVSRLGGATLLDEKL
jgi:hypothetical protein